MTANQPQIELKPSVTGPAPTGGFVFAEDKMSKHHIF